jgi:hypothetical protein
MLGVVYDGNNDIAAQRHIPTGRACVCGESAGIVPLLRPDRGNALADRNGFRILEVHKLLNYILYSSWISDLEQRDNSGRNSEKQRR